MQQRRYRPGDVLDDYCPRERRITDHAIVAMIEDHIKQTRCVVCDAEHEYKEGKVPAQRRKKAKSALFEQVLDGLQGPAPAARLAHAVEPPADEAPPDAAIAAAVPSPVVVAQALGSVADDGPEAPAVEPLAAKTGEPRDEGPVRRPLIRATLPRPEGQPPIVTRAIPEFTIRQPNTGRGGAHRPGGRRRGGGFQPQGPSAHGLSRFGRGGANQRQHGGRPPGNSNRGGARRGGKKR